MRSPSPALAEEGGSGRALSFHWSCGCGGQWSNPVVSITPRRDMRAGQGPPSPQPLPRKAGEGAARPAGGRAARHADARLLHRPAREPKRRATPIVSGRRPLISRCWRGPGLPTPGGFCLTADAYRGPDRPHLGLHRSARADNAAADAPRAAPPVRRDQARGSTKQPIALEILDALLDACAARHVGGSKAVRGAPRRWSRIARAPTSPASSRASSASATRLPS